MTREEEVRVSALKYVDNFIPDICGMCDEDVYDAFVSGAKWADEHPKDVWHSADEEPDGRDWRILCEGESGNCWVASRRDAFTIGYNWQEFAEDEALTRWAYINDLLPKGGEE